MRRVLLVDDDPGVLDALALALRDRYAVLTARDGAEALEVIARDPIDAVLLDLMMPVLDGAGFVHGMRAAGCDVPVVLATASTDAEAQARALGARDFLVKPFDVDALEAKLDQLLGPNGGPVGDGGGGRRRGDGAARRRGDGAGRRRGDGAARRPRTASSTARLAA